MAQVSHEAAGAPGIQAQVHDPAHQAYQILRLAFTVAPIVAGADKFLGLLTNWERYLSPPVASLVGGNGHTLMLGVGVVEIAAGLLVAFKPRIGGYVVAAWLAGIIVNLLLIPGFYDVAFRDFGLALAALALARLSLAYPDPTGR
ncbi:MAG: hypothetical protein ACK47B_15610 [Armatimonadota bacterium]